MEDAITKLLAYLAGGSIVFAGAAGIAWLFFKKYSETWLESKFAAELEETKKEHQKELQRIQMQIDARLDRAIKLHGKEFDVLSEAWRMLDLATAAARNMSGSMITVPPLNNMLDTMLNLTLAETDFSPVIQEQIRTANDREKMWSDAHQLRIIMRAEKTRVEFYCYFMANGLWMQKDIRDQFQAIHDLNSAAWGERNAAFSMRGMRIVPTYTASQELTDKAPGLLQKLQDDISDRLWRSAVELSP